MASWVGRVIPAITNCPKPAVVLCPTYLINAGQNGGSYQLSTGIY